MNEHDEIQDMDVHVVVPADDRGAVELECGHSTRKAAIVTFSGGRSLFECPDGCGLQDRRSVEA